MNTARFDGLGLQMVIRKVKKLWDQGITDPNEIGERINQPDYIVIDCLELIEKFSSISK